MSFEKSIHSSQNIKDLKLVENNEEQEYTFYYNPDFLDFQNVEVTRIDDTKPWKPALEVKITKNDGSIIEKLDANTPFFIFQDSEGNNITVTAVAAAHIDQLHIKNKDAGSKFDYSSLKELFKDVAKKLPPKIANQSEISAFSIDMGRYVGKEGVASVEELKAEGILTDSDLNNIESVRTEVEKLNKSGDEIAKKEFLKKFKTTYPNCKIQFQLIRDGVLVPTVDAPKRNTTKLFIVLGPGLDGKRTIYTMTPGRYMPRHPNPNEHKNEKGELNEKTFKESADAWFNTVLLIGK